MNVDFVFFAAYIKDIASRAGIKEFFQFTLSSFAELQESSSIKGKKSFMEDRLDSMRGRLNSMTWERYLFPKLPPAGGEVIVILNK